MARLNSSHNNINWHKKMINTIKKMNDEIDILVDIPGVKPRTNNTLDIDIKKNDIVHFGQNINESSKNFIKLLPINPEPPVTMIFFILNYVITMIKYIKLIKEMSFKIK